LVFAEKTPPHLPHVLFDCCVCIGEAAEKLAGGRGGELVVCPTFKPQRPQNFDCADSRVAQRGQENQFPAASFRLIKTNERLPHLPQNLTPSANLD
jgi:hypothetical protein